MHVVHLLTEGSIEERVWKTLQLKKSLFAGVFDSPTGEVSFAELGKKSILQAVKEIFADQPQRPKPLIDPVPGQAVPVLLESLAALARSAPTGEGLSNLVSRDPSTNSPVLSIPLPPSIDTKRLTRAISAFSARLADQKGIFAIRFIHSSGRLSAQMRIRVSATLRTGACCGMPSRTPGLLPPRLMNSAKHGGIVRLSWLTRIRRCSDARRNTNSSSRLSNPAVWAG